MKKHIPNIVSAIRVVLAYPIAQEELACHWQVAFWLIVFGVVTDLLDGWLAIRLKATTKFGKDWWDPLCDSAMNLGIVAGLVLEGGIRHDLLPEALLMLAVGLTLKITKHQTWNESLRRAANITLPACYCFAVPVVMIYIFCLAYGEEAFHLAMTMAIIAGAMAVAFKRHRVADWLNGRR